MKSLSIISVYSFEIRPSLSENRIDNKYLKWPLPQLSSSGPMRPNNKKNNANKDNITWLNVPTGTEQLAIYGLGWGFEIGSTEKQLQLSGQSETWLPTSRLLVRTTQSSCLLINFNSIKSFDNNHSTLSLAVKRALSLCGFTSRCLNFLIALGVVYGWHHGLL